MESVQRQLTVVNPCGLHGRASARLVEAARRFRANLTLCRGGQEADCRSILEVMGLACAQGTVVSLRGEGEDAQEAVEALSALMEDGFGER
ncbi:MAG: HPr family phosphocarrier protein [Thermodesulfobacteriota bacterium]